VATINVNQDRLNKLYEYDYDFVSAAMTLSSLTSAQNLRYDPTAPSSVQTPLATVASALSDFKQKWAVRMEAVENILVTR
jgi:hypothetical protein